jgi:hypothetical protein
LVIFGSGKKEHPWPRTLEGRTWSVKRVRVPDYTYMAHRIKMYILAFPGMCPVYGRYIGPKNRFEDSLKTCKDKLRSMLVIWWQLLHTKCFVYGVYTPYTVGRFFIFYYTTGVNPSRGLRAISNFFSFCQSMLSAAPVCARGPAILRPSVPEAETTGHKCERGRGE